MFTKNNSHFCRPYYMSRGLMEFVQNSKEFKEKKWAKRGGEQTTVQTVS